MSLISICHICGAPATHTCSFCGKPVCRNDFDFRTTTCKACLSKRQKPEKQERPRTRLFQ